MLLPISPTHESSPRVQPPLAACSAFTRGVSPHLESDLKPKISGLRPVSFLVLFAFSAHLNLNT